MIGYLRGTVKALSEESALIEVSGVGYEVLMPINQLVALSLGDSQVELWIYTNVREDALQLFGFLNPQDKEFYLSLLKINGVGPKMGLSIMGGATQDQLIEMIEREDIKSLSRLPKVGKKTAEQMVLALKGKLVKASEEPNPKGRVDKVSLPPAQAEVMSALVNLGYRSQDVEKIVTGLPSGITLQEGVRKSLQMISQGNNL